MTRTSPKAKLGGKNHINLSVDTRYPSPVAATTLVKTITRCSFAKSPRASFISLPTTHASTSKPPDSISEEEYFRLLKKTDVLGHLLRVNDNLLEAEGLLEVAEVDNSKLDAMNKHILVELQMFKAKYYESQRLFTDHIEQLTEVCLHQEALQKGHPEEAAAQVADKFKHIRLMEDLQQATTSSRLLSATDDVQSRALVVVAQLRVDQLNGFYQSYCRDLHTAENVVAEEKAKGYLAISYVTGMSSFALHDEIATLKQKLELQKQVQRQDKAALLAQQTTVTLVKLKKTKNTEIDTS
ncbi:hypothetical protein DYB28_012911, partial [Aphanomyces astaci]